MTSYRTGLCPAAAEADSPGIPVFWRDSRMPHVELRTIGDGRQVYYAPHSHTQWSLGAITAGSSAFLHRDEQFRISAGSLVLMNPNWVHVCNPIDNLPWAYMMLYVDTNWLTCLRYDSGLLDVPLTLLALAAYLTGHLIRVFKRYFGLTPHAYLINCRIQRGQQELKSGKPIAETPLTAGFTDQPHFQRTFKRLLAATPKQYRQPSLSQ